MSISKTLQKFGRVVAYHPEFARLFGDVKAGILFSQLFYWAKHVQNPKGVYKTA